MMKWPTLLLLFIQVIKLIKAEFQCPGTADCICSSGITGDYELLCPKALTSPTLMAHVLPEKYAHIQCTVMKNWEDMRLIAGLKIGPVESFTVRLCPLPGSSFRELMKTVGIPRTQALQVTTHGNLSDTLTRKHLEGLLEITRLDLSTNFLTNLPEDLFRDTSNLTWLDLKNNHVKLPKNIFRYVPKLEVLELGSNNLSYLETGIFRNLTKLRLLNLWGNKLRNLSRALFSDVPNLESLDLNSNGLNNVPPDIFADLPKLKNINLTANNFTSLPQALFLGNTNLETFQMQNNRGSLSTLPSGMLANLKYLQTVQLPNCNINNLGEDFLAGSISLINLTLQRNYIVTIPSNLFKDNKKLDNLNLSFNKIIYIPDQLFQTTTQLKILNLANNAITNISEYTFSTLNNLEVLNLSHNFLEHLSKQAFEKTVALKTLDLSHNRIQNFHSEYPGLTFGPPSILQSSIHLEALYLAHNNITDIYSDWTISMTQLTILDLSHNNVKNISYNELHSVVARKLLLDLSYNEINYIDLNDAESLGEYKYVTDRKNDFMNNHHGVRVLLRGNPMICDCRAYRLVRYFRDELSPEVRYAVDFDGTDLTCASGDIADDSLTGELVKSLDPKLLTCTLTPCVDNCTCFYRPFDTGLLVDCSERHLDTIPSYMPNNSTIENIEVNTNHTELDLSHNRLEVVPKIFGQGYDRVTKLNLAYNNLRQVNFTSLSPDLQIINLDNNNISKLDTGSLNALKNFTSIKEITLTNNPWSCECDAKDFLDFVFSNFDKIPHGKNITCKSGERLSHKINELCSPIAENLKTSSIIIGVFLLLFGITIGILYYRFQREIKVWLYAHRMCLWFVTEEELDKDKQYDAFVSYSSLDENFVVNKLVPGLEDGATKYKLCLHYRDWIVGDFIPNQIVRSVEESRRTIVVLSPNFLKSVWTRMEFRAAHSQALSEGRARVIVILYGDIGPTENLDPELKAYLSMNTYVRWGDVWFWDKLRYALPHPSQLSKGVPLISQPASKRQKRTSHNEKLINGTDPSVPNPSVTTPPADSTIIADPLKLIDSKPT